MTDNWITAAQRYAAKNNDLDIAPERFPAIAAIVREMMSFHRSPEAADAMLMLELSGSAILFGEGFDKEGEKVLFCWTSRGPSRILTGKLAARIIGGPLPAPFYDCAKALVRNGMNAEEFPQWFKMKLDEIAAKAPGE